MITTTVSDVTGRVDAHGGDDSKTSGVSWGAIIGGAVAAAALSLILLVLGTGLGLSAASPWSMTASKATAIGVSTVVWIVLTSIAASALGGYIAGRLRVKWANVHGDEVYFRDTAHGMLAWALATLVTAAMLTSAIGSVLGTATQAGGEVAKGALNAAAGAATAAAPAATSAMSSPSTPAPYDMDTLFRSDAPVADPMDAQSRAEVTRIMANSLRTGNLSNQDRTYVAGIVARKTGLAPAEAQRRVDETYARMNKAMNDAIATAKQAADTARHAAELGALWMFVALLSGAFSASLAAMFGGRRRDASIV